MPALAVGADIGGTKTALQWRSGDDCGDATVSSTGWSVRAPEASIAWLLELISSNVPAWAASGEGVSLVVGANGVESDAQCSVLTGIAVGRLPRARIRILNDAELVLPAAGYESGIALIGGTGAIALGRDRAGAMVRSSGWGWVLGDDGSASALVREAVRALCAAADAGQARDVLETALLRESGAVDLPQLAGLLSWEGGVETWGRYAPVVFEAAEHGSEIARAVIARGVEALSRAVQQVRERGAVGVQVVLAGGLFTARDEYAKAVMDSIAALDPALACRMFTGAPATGALRLAQQLVREVRRD